MIKHETITALITPMINGQIDYQSLDNIINHQIKSKVNGIVLFGSTGEGRTISLDIKKNVIKHLQKNHVNIPITINIHASTIDNIKNEISEYKSLNIEQILLAPIPYIKLTQEDILNIFEIINKLSDNICVYNIPSRSSVSITNETMLKIVDKCKNVKSLKDADYSTIFNNLSNLDIKIYSGDDMTSLATNANGCSGVISVISNLLPSAMREMMSCVEHNIAQSTTIWKNLVPIIKFLDTHNPKAIKYIMYKTGMISSSECLAPLLGLNDLDISDITNHITKHELQ